MTPAFLSGERLQHIASEIWFGSDVPNESEVFAAVACATVVLELVLAGGLRMKKPRRILLPLGIAMHVAFAVMLPVQTPSFLD
jgi:hypothetical protein